MPLFLKAGVLLGTYLSGCLLAHCWATRRLYIPKPASYVDEGVEGFVKLRTASGLSISAMHLQNPEARHTILFHHGNGSDLGRILPHMQEMRRHGFAVFAYDYPGYGTSEGSPSVAGLYEAGQSAYDYLRNTLTPSDIILVGRSLGGGVATEIACRNRAAGLILESTFSSTYLTKIPFPFFLGDKFHNLSKVAKIQMPLLVIHGTEDKLIPFKHGQQLYAKAQPPKQSFWVQGAGHYDYQSHHAQYWQTLRNFSESLS